MLCRSPFVKGELPFGCGQCMACRIKRRRIWTHRMMLESFLHSESCFITLTYAPEHLPPDGSVVPRDAVLFLKRFRERIKPVKVRYFLVGEYGDETERPHYHAALFGVGRAAEPDIAAAWGLGLVHVGDLEQKSAQYIAGYVTKKMTKSDDPRLRGRHPEFARMSRMPAIGSGAIAVMADAMNDREGSKEIARLGDVPSTLKHGGKDWPLGRVLKEKFRDAMGFDEKSLPEAKLAEWVAEMHAMRIDKGASKAAWKALKPMIEHNKLDQIEKRASIWRRKASL